MKNYGNKEEYVHTEETIFRYYTEANEDGEIILFVQNRANRPESWYTWSEPQELGELFGCMMNNVQPKIELGDEFETLGDITEW